MVHASTCCSKTTRYSAVLCHREMESNRIPCFIVHPLQRMFSEVWSDYKRICVCPALVALDKRVRGAKEFKAIEQETLRRVTIVEEAWQQKKGVRQESRPAVREVDDDWFILLDVATKKSGITELI